MKQREDANNTTSRDSSSAFWHWLWWTVGLQMFWTAMTGTVEPSSFFVGLACSGIVAWLTSDGTPRASDLPARTVSSLWLVVKYLARFLVELVLSNVQVAALVLHPKLPIAPQVVRFRTNLKRQISKAILANTITLTPGTITLDIEGDEFIVHTLTRDSAEGVCNWVMQDILAEMEAVSDGHI